MHQQPPLHFFDRRRLDDRLRAWSDALMLHPLGPIDCPSQGRRSHACDRMLRLGAWLKRKRQRIALVLIGYVLVWSIPLLLGEPLLTVFALVPLLLVPPVGLLIYRLVWKEFHA